VITLKIKIGNSMLEYQAETMEKVHRFSNIWGGLPESCSCGSKDIFLAFTETQEGFKYCKLKCKKCESTYTIKQNKKNEYYIDPNEKFVKFQKGQGSQSSPQPQEESPFQNDDIPF